MLNLNLVVDELHVYIYVLYITYILLYFPEDDGFWKVLAKISVFNVNSCFVCLL